MASPGSSDDALSSHSSSEFDESVKEADDADSALVADTHLMPPSKRRRVGGGGGGGGNGGDNSSHQSTPMPDADDVAPRDYGYVSDDTMGSIPSSPNNDQFTMMTDEDPRLHQQVRVCKWERCSVGDLENMDNLVNHLHEDHIGSKETNYACEWNDCNRKGTPHASGYALKAHMRSHTKEKPFYCILPECDRSFTRSDALAKHMRTVHETEALRPSDPVPRNYNSAHFKPQRLKLTLKPPSSSLPTATDDLDSNAMLSPPPPDFPNGDNNAPPAPIHYDDPTPTTITFTPQELSLPWSQLFRLQRRKLDWSQRVAEQLNRDVEALEQKRKEEWIAKELVLANLMEAELAVAHDRGEPDANVLRVVEEDLPKEPLPLVGARRQKGVVPWYRRMEEEGEA